MGMLRDAARSGVYRVSRADEVLEPARDAGLSLLRIDLGQPVFEAFARALSFPEWFGHNWDALEDCLTDLSWREPEGHLLLLEGGGADAELADVLASAARFWAGEGRRFFAVFVDPDGRLRLPGLGGA